MAELSNNEFDLIRAIADRDASVQDIAASLKKQGVNSVDDVIAYLRSEAAQAERVPSDALKPVSLDRFAVPVDYKPSAAISPRSLAVPVLIDGDLIDPKDIYRFDGHELHLVVSPDQQSVVGITDRRTISKWWEMSYIKSQISPPIQKTAALAYYQPPTPICVYYEHNDFRGSSIDHGKNRGYYDLSKVHSGLFGWGASWNDRISSLQIIAMGICVIHEDHYWSGSSVSFAPGFASGPESPFGGYLYMAVEQITQYGMNDRVSAVEGW